MAEPYNPTRRRLLRDLTGAGVGIAGAGLIGCADEEKGAADAATPSCTLTPELTEGPFYLDLDKILVRRDRGQAGPAPGSARQGR